MATDYFAQVTQGIVSDVRRVTHERIAENADLYPGVWIEVPDMDHYPAIGWTWTEADGFQPPVDG